MDFFHIKVGIRGHEVKHIVFLVAKPVFPTDVPALHQDGVKTVTCGKVDIALHVGRVGRVCAVGLGVCKICFAQFHRAEIVGIAPRAFVGNHVPPNADIFRRLDPRSILDFAGFVEVERQSRGQDVGGFVAHHHCAPGRHTGCLQIAFVAACVGSEPRVEGHGLVVVVEVHARVVYARGLVYINV